MTYNTASVHTRRLQNATATAVIIDHVFYAWNSSSSIHPPACWMNTAVILGCVYFILYICEYNFYNTAVDRTDEVARQHSRETWTGIPCSISFHACYTAACRPYYCWCIWSQISWDYPYREILNYTQNKTNLLLLQSCMFMRGGRLRGERLKKKTAAASVLCAVPRD